MGAPFDAVNGLIGPGGTRLPVWPVLGEVDHGGGDRAGQAPRPGEAAVSASQCQDVGAGRTGRLPTTVDGMTQYPIVGAYRARPPFEDLAAGGLSALPGAEGRELRVVIDDVASARSTVRSILSILAPTDAGGTGRFAGVALASACQDFLCKGSSCCCLESRGSG